jgi:hypothetical protein
MSPYCHQMGHNEPSGSTSGIAGLETADPDTGTPTPSPTLSVTPSPPPHAEEPAEAAVSADDDQLLMVMNPLPVVQDGAPDCLPVDHNLPNLLVRWSVTCRGTMSKFRGANGYDFKHL